MSRKTQVAYQHLFKYIKDNIFELNGKSIMTDFERAMRNALADIYPDTKMYTCWFHFTQAAKKQAMKTNRLIELIRTDSTARNIYFQLMAIPLLPAKYIIQEFERLKYVAMNQYKREFKYFLNYYESQWIKKVRHLENISYLFIIHQLNIAYNSRKDLKRYLFIEDPNVRQERWKHSMDI